MTILVVMLLFSMVLLIIQSFRTPQVWDRLLCYAGISTRTAVLMVLLSRLHDDSTIALVAAVVLCLGNSGLLLLANLFKGTASE